MITSHISSESLEKLNIYLYIYIVAIKFKH